jgi:hypothetical protein
VEKVSVDEHADFTLNCFILLIVKAVQHFSYVQKWLFRMFELWRINDFDALKN